MMEFKYECRDSRTGIVNRLLKYKTDEETLTEVLKDFHYFLIGCGFVFKGEVGLIDQNEE